MAKLKAPKPTIEISMFTIVTMFEDESLSIMLDIDHPDEGKSNKQLVLSKEEVTGIKKIVNFLDFG